ncbi:ABC transporter ATP-binding protein [Geitlerinema sp. PCC 9228]|jgi:lipopolysaccharide transport system ATP-binding protein|uniref:ABC transporter ATP-binding protein n=1 Tax=Geitlerinema sp. PCC 9228 TaxID=111611 RepID=UPI0008F9AC60|nr:ABC transporter ATP-binding protein [Geitlerinema sp. PCC 9228]
MSEIAISLQNVCKCFKRYHHPVDRLKELLLPGKSRAEEFWALQNINLEVAWGETLGIVGRNGSGKSTLLQIIAGTLLPTTGEVSVGGKISALLELGSGFNPEFTGRQNVFFNGQLLGLTPAQIDAKFNDIAGFADIGDFIDRPVKTYSSGMFMRLAFAVAINVEPDILVVDEALSVGDEAFQRKCFARIREIRERGGIILFVSHSASQVLELCDEAVLMDHGELLLRHHPKVVLDKYHKLIYAPSEQYPFLRQEICHSQQSSLTALTPQKETSTALELKTSRNGHDRETSEATAMEEFFDPNLVPDSTTSYISRGATIIDPQVTTPEGMVVNNLISRRDYIYTYAIRFQKSANNVRLGMLIKTVRGLELGGASFVTASQTESHIEAGTLLTVQFHFKCVLNPGVYFLNAGVSGVVDGQFTYMDRRIDVAMFRVLPNNDSFSSGIVDLLIEPQLTSREQISIQNPSSQPPRLKHGGFMPPASGS